MTPKKAAQSPWQKIEQMERVIRNLVEGPICTARANLQGWMLSAMQKGLTTFSWMLLLFLGTFLSKKWHFFCGVYFTPIKAVDYKEASIVTELLSSSYHI